MVPQKLKINFLPVSLLCVVLFVLSIADVSAQKHSYGYYPGRVLFGLRPDVQQPGFLQKNNEIWPSASWKSVRVLSKTMHIWSVEMDPDRTLDALVWLRAQPEVTVAQLDHFVIERTVADSSAPSGYFNDPITPNDSLYGQQWYHANNVQTGNDLGSPFAWDVATGGVTPEGDTIVIAIIDSGFKQSHVDWGQNLWVNREEVPNDDVDNDINGLVDDYRGWNVIEQNDDLSGATMNHGTPVAGIIGARGNNIKGITGINWQAKLMLVAATGDGLESDILLGYDYVLQARQRYNMTNGQSGAFVVAVNCSFGINYGTPQSSPIWCSVLDDLGHAGIMTIGAAANDNVNVDLVGDIPTTCPSPYLIAVTSLTRQHTKPAMAAIGPQSVDLGAYGWEVMTLLAHSPHYGTQSGTSFAAPQVSGAVGLLYSAPCTNLTALAKANPREAVIMARELILNHTQPITALSGNTTTGGGLDLAGSLMNYQDGCMTCPKPYILTASYIGTDAMRLSWTQTTEMPNVKLRWRPVGATMWTFVMNVTLPYDLQGLSACSDYEFSVQAECSAGQFSDWTEAFQFKTDGCCVAPIQVEVPYAINEVALIGWSSVTASDQYAMRYRPHSGSWTEINNLINTQHLIQGLTTCTQYEVQVRSTCGGIFTPWSGSIFFHTTGCGSCLESAYCNSSGQDVSEEWIGAVQIGDDWLHASGGYTGYQLFPLDQQPDTLILMPNQMYMATVTPEFAGTTYQEQFRIFVDSNLDGDFNDSGELVFDPGFSHNGPLTDTFLMPDFGGSGVSRMRVSMKFKPTNVLALPEPCENFAYGQVKDYCVILRQPVNSTESVVPAASTLRVSPLPARRGCMVYVEMPSASSTASLYNPRQLRVFDLRGNLLTTEVWPSNQDVFVLNSSLWPAGLYTVEVADSRKVLHTKLLITN
jgi:serine protease